MSEDSVEIQSIAKDVERLRQERPHTRPFVDPFVGVLLARTPLVDSLVEEGKGQPAPKPDLTKLGLGGALEPHDTLPLDASGVRRVFEALQQVLVNGFPAVRGDLMNIGAVAAGKEGFLMELARDMLGDRQRFLIRTAHSFGVDPLVLGFWCIQILTPLAMARGRLLRGLVPDGVWNRGYCPVCGSWPSLAHHTETGRMMTCSFCASRWQVTLPECPFCGAAGPFGQVAMPGVATERLVICQNCHHYLGEIVGEPFPGMSPEVEALSLAPLEFLVRQQGGSPANLDWRQMLWVH